ncbi:hypothetical protein SAY87_007002 [Trapa incisa]|uniref:Uncharacterized protein n=2 Tax=Trapa TaxID=22665 RepID=A0AAN7QTQ0_TRANT|nr:hypothetical protein SAY87_007002 [Trapa incisa]KAK4775203.1 hypothetical protein SAY86_010138 [Trapa natans]
MLGKQKENNHPEELVRFSEELQQKELDGAAEGGSHQCTTKWRDQSSDVSKNAIIRKKSLTFLLKIFLCRSGFPSIPILRDPPPEPRIEKVMLIMHQHGMSPVPSTFNIQEDYLNSITNILVPSPIHFRY